VQAVLAIVIAYLLGSVDFGVIVPRLLGVDIYEHGSGNPGASNVFRTLGRKAAAVVLLGDAAKGLAAAAIGDLWVSEPVGFACATAAVLGHTFPIWHRFRGGRGVATALGAAIWLEPVFGLVAAVAWGGVVAATKVASVASLVAMVLYVPGFALTGQRGWSLVWASATALIVIGRHAANIERMIRRDERRITG
jgi:acyl phosphate:glycerol-3-phosphate acyltransferase